MAHAWTRGHISREIGCLNNGVFRCLGNVKYKIIKNSISKDQHDKDVQVFTKKRLRTQCAIMAVSINTSMGTFKIQLHCDLVQEACWNFLGLCASGKYTGCLFHRVINEFMIQTGDASNTGKKSQALEGGKLKDQIVDQLDFSTSGIVAMANRGKKSNKGIGSQFFITLKPAIHLNETCTIIGYITQGLDVVSRISQAKVDDSNCPVTPIFIESIKIHSNPFASGQVPLAGTISRDEN